MGELNHLLYNTGALFVCPLTVCICPVSPDSKGTNSLIKILLPFCKSIAAARSRAISCLFTRRIWRQAFLLLNLVIWCLSVRWWQTWMSLSHMSTPISWNTSKTFCSRTLLPLIDVHILTFSSLSLLKYWAFSLTLGRHNPFYQLTIHIPDNSHICLHIF